MAPESIDVPFRGRNLKIAGDRTIEDCRVITWQVNGFHGWTALHLNSNYDVYGGGIRLCYETIKKGGDHEPITLARVMTKKANLIGLPFSGGKTVVRHCSTDCPKALLIEAISDLVVYLKGCYFIGGDLNFTEQDVKAVSSLLKNHPQRS